MLSVVTVLAKPRPRGWPPASPRAVGHLTCFACTRASLKLMRCFNRDHRQTMANDCRRRWAPAIG